MALWITGNGTEDLPDVLVLAQGEEESDGMDRISTLLGLGLKDALDELDLFLRDVNHVLRAQFWKVLESALFFLLKHGFEFCLMVILFSILVLLGRGVSGLLEPDVLLIALLNLLIVCKVGQELAPSDEFFVVDGIFFL